MEQVQTTAIFFFVVVALLDQSLLIQDWLISYTTNVFTKP